MGTGVFGGVLDFPAFMPPSSVFASVVKIVQDSITFPAGSFHLSSQAGKCEQAGWSHTGHIARSNS